MRIGEVADRAAVPTKTIRYWEAERLLPAPARTASGYRDYRPDIVERLAFIRHAQAGGLTLGQIRQILDIGDSGDIPCAHVVSAIADRLADVDRRLAELADTRRHLQTLLRRAATQDPASCRGYCTIITG